MVVGDTVRANNVWAE